MKIGLVSTDPLCFHGGVQEQIKGLYKFFNSNGHEAKIIAPRYSDDEDYGRDFILVGDSFKFPWNGSWGSISYCFNIRKLIKTFDREGFDVLHFHNAGLFTSMEVLLLSDSVNILTLHALPDFSLFYKAASPLYQLFAKTVSNKMDGLITVSKASLNYMKFMKKYFNGRVEVIPNGIDTKKFSPKNKRMGEFDDGKKNILFVGRIEKRKGLSYLINAFRAVKRKNDDTRLIVVGDGDLKEELEERVEGTRLKDVVFVGSKDGKEIPKYYATADIFCSPAVKGEAFGVVLLEAMASGKPIVAFANRGYREVLRNYDKRFLIEPRNTKGLARALLDLVGNDRLRESLGLWGLKESRKYSWDVVGKRMLEFYKKCAVPRPT